MKANNPKMTLKIGDRVMVNATVVDSYGYTEARPFAMATASAVQHAGLEGVIEKFDFDYGKETFYPDAYVRMSSGILMPFEICNLSKVLPLVASKPVTKRAGAARKMSPQCTMILKHLQSGNTITQRSALLDFGVMALPRRIADLKEHGHNVTSFMEHNKLTGQRYARYSLNKAA